MLHSTREAKQAAAQLMSELEQTQRLDFTSSTADPQFSSQALQRSGRGHMLGVLVARDAAGQRHTLRAFSGQFNGAWTIDGWAPPIADWSTVQQKRDTTSAKIEQLTKQLEHLASDARSQALTRQRRHLSCELLAVLQAAYIVRNFRGETKLLKEVYLGRGRMPGGTGDCGAPKLLHAAAAAGLVPIGLAEFWWGPSTASGSRRQGQFYPACTSKCEPILGFMLCGLDERSTG